MKEKIVKYIEAYIPCTICQFSCSYCYVRQRAEYKKEIIRIPDIYRCGRALSSERLGGSALINFCAGGETLLHPDLPELIRVLAEEGHFLSIVTNGIYTKGFEDILEKGVNFEQLFFKCSFHFNELNRTNNLDTFIKNIQFLKDNNASYSIELVASDDQIPFIDDIKKVSLDAFGALPHVTIPRDDRTSDIDLMTTLPMEEYKRTWESFDSELFRYKMFILYKKQKNECMAGKWTYMIDVVDGYIWQCLGHDVIGNIYEDMDKGFPIKTVGCDCRLPYCYNGHVYYAMGDVEAFPAPYYIQMRDRITNEGSHWINETMRDVFSQRLYENNREE